MGLAPHPVSLSDGLGSAKRFPLGAVGHVLENRESRKRRRKPIVVPDVGMGMERNHLFGRARDTDIRQSRYGPVGVGTNRAGPFQTGDCLCDRDSQANNYPRPAAGIDQYTTWADDSAGDECPTRRNAAAFTARFTGAARCNSNRQTERASANRGVSGMRRLPHPISTSTREWRALSTEPVIRQRPELERCYRDESSF